MTRAMIFERDVPIGLRDGATLAGNLYRPVGEGRFPVLMTLGPYGKDRHWADRNQQHARDLGGGPFINWETPDPETWVPKGYAVLRVDGRGTGASPGYLDPLSAGQARDYYDAIEWAAAQPWCTGRIGLLGISYYAMSQWAVAALRPPHLAAMIPWEGAADLYRDFMRHGGILSGRFLAWWWPNTILNVQHGAAAGCDPAELAGHATPPLLDQARAQPLDGDFYRGWLPDLSRIEVPFLSVGNWGNQGLHLRGNTEAFTQAGSTAKWLRIAVGDHIHPFYAPENVALQARFFGHFLKGEETGWLTEPAVTLAIRHDAAVTWRAEAAWPIPRTEWTSLHLDAGRGALDTGPAPVPAEAAYDPQRACLSFTTPPFPARTEITGPGTVRLWISSATADADVFVQLRKQGADGAEALGIDPAGGAISLACGWLRASQRKLDPGRSLPYRPYHAHDEVQPLEPGVPVPLDIEIWPTSIVCEAGSRLVLEVGGADLAHAYFLHGGPADRPADLFAGPCRLHTGPDHPCRLLLPIVPDAG